MEHFDPEVEDFRSRVIYLDHAATTPVDPRVMDTMVPYFSIGYGNAASAVHGYGRQAREAVEHARHQLAGTIGADPSEIVFTSGATEANNLALAGVARAAPPHRRGLIAALTEHESVLAVLDDLEGQGFTPIRFPVDERGCLDLEALSRAIDDSTLLISVMLANNEVGTIHPVSEIARIAHRRGALLHCDAAQAFGKIPVRVDELDADLLSLSAHKTYGPKGTGALYVRNPVSLAPLLRGGDQERGLRPGTQNVPGIVGMGRAAKVARDELPAEGRRTEALRDRLEKILTREISGVTVRGDRSRRLPHLTSVTIDGIHQEALMHAAPGVAFSAGSACSSERSRPSHVLTALGLDAARSRNTVRFAVGRFTTEDDVDSAASQLVAAVGALRRVGLD